MDINFNLSEAEIIRDIRKHVGLSQRDFAEYFEIPVRTLQDWEQGKRTPPNYLITMILRVLEIETTFYKSAETQNSVEGRKKYNMLQRRKHQHIIEIPVEKLTVDFEKKRDCYPDLVNFMTNNRHSRICAIYGLRRTGKTVMMQQAAKELTTKGIPCAFFTCNEDATMQEVEYLLEKALKKGIKCVFIDEITFAADFQQYCSVLSDVYAAQGMNIAISGTDSLGISFATAGRLYDRVEKIHTTYIPFSEFNRLLGKGIDDYITYGGTLTDRTYKDQKTSIDYRNTAIVANILHSITASEGVYQYPPALTELYEADELVSAINKIINEMNQNITSKALQKDYVNHGLSVTLSNYGQDFKRGKNVLNFRDYIDVDQVTLTTKEALHVKNVDESQVTLKPAHLDEIKEYLKSLGLFIQLPVFASLKEFKETAALELLMQPGMAYAHSTTLLDALIKTESWVKDCGINNKQEFMIRADRGIKGVILENAIIANTYLNFYNNADLYISKLSLYKDNKRNEIDLLVVDKAHNLSYVFEIKYAKEAYPEQTRHLNDLGFISYIDEHFGTVAGKYVLYNGPSDFKDDIQYINVEEYLNLIGLHKGAWELVVKNLNNKRSLQDRISLFANQQSAQKEQQIKEEPQKANFIRDDLIK